tara:strand:+ start:81 stop:617 length:537 start_codon:yes stop_codon:yes gene_type:complete
MSLSQYQSTFGDFATWQDRWCLTADNVPKEFHIELSNERKAEIKQLKDHIDEMEDSVLDANESFTLQQQSNCLWFKGEPMCDAETGDEITMDTYVKYVKSFHGPPTKKSCAEIENVKLKIELAKLKAENEKLKVSDKILDAYNKFINEGQGWDWFIYEISDEDKQMFVDAGLPEEDFD